MSLLLIFILLNIANVIMQTVKSIVTIKSGKTVAAITNAVAFALYTVVTVYTLCDLPLGLKALVVGLINLVGVFIVKWIEELLRKDKLWKIDLSVRNNQAELLRAELKGRGISHHYVPVGKYTTFTCFSETQKESLFVKELCDKYKAKYFVTETKIL